MTKKLRRLLGVLVVASTLSIGLVTTSTTASASTSSINGETGIEKVTLNAVASKYIQMIWNPSMPVRYLYDDGMYRGNLYLVGAWRDTDGTTVLGGWLEGNVYCYTNCTLARGIDDELK